MSPSSHQSHSPEWEVPQFPTPDELWNLTFAEANEWRDRFAEVPFEDKGGYFQGRYYQDIAVERVLEAIAAGKDRILLTLATGTGKTFIAFQLAWKLFQNPWNPSREPTRRPRILFLADRNILANQAYNAFSAFPEDALVRIEPDEIRKKGKVPKNGSIFFTIFQTFMCGPGDTPYFGEYPLDFFDFIGRRCPCIPGLLRYRVYQTNLIAPQHTSHCWSQMDRRVIPAHSGQFRSSSPADTTGFA
jgi:type I restriction enzyme R subunit